MIKLEGENGENNTLLLGPAKSAGKPNKVLDNQNTLIDLQTKAIEGQEKLLKQQEENENLIKRLLTLTVVLIFLAFITLSFVIIK